jgi:hypothetical protein
MTYDELTAKGRKSVDALVMHIVSLPFSEDREEALRLFEATAAEGYQHGAGLSPEAAAQMAEEWIGIVRERAAAVAVFSRLPLSPNA